MGDSYAGNDARDVPVKRGTNPPWRSAFARIASLGLAYRLVTAMFLLAVLVFILIDPTRIGWDQAGGLQEGDLLLHHNTLYVDVVDIQPPLFPYLNVIPAAVARLFGFHLVPTFLVGVWLLVVYSVVATRRYLAKACGTASLHVDLVAMSIAVYSLLVLHRNDFGQREHLFVLGLLPYLALRFLRAEGGDTAATPAAIVGVLTAIVACQKPHFVAVVLAVEVFWMATRRPIRAMIRPELVALVLTGALYPVCMLLMPQASRAAYFGRWLPMIMSGYGAYDLPWSGLLSWLPWIPPTACALLLVVGDIPERPIFRFARPMAIATLVAVVGFFIQHKGWPYQLIPAEGLLAAMVALVAGEVNLRLPTKVLCAALAVVLAGELTVAAVLTIRPRYDAALAKVVRASEIGQALVTYTAPGDPVLVVSTSTMPAYPLLTQLDRWPGARGPFWSLSMLYFGMKATAGHPFDYHLTDLVKAAEEARFRADLAEDVRNRRPKLVVIASFCQGCPEGFSLRDYLSQTGFLQTSMKNYRELSGFQTASVFLLETAARGGPGRP